mgnify:CR=1 FL=1
MKLAFGYQKWQLILITFLEYVRLTLGAFIILPSFSVFPVPVHSCQTHKTLLPFLNLSKNSYLQLSHKYYHRFPLL